MPKSWSWFLRLSGVIALLLFLSPTAYVLKYYLIDKPRETTLAQSVSTHKITPTASVDIIAPLIPPTEPGNAAEFYVPAIQSYADRDLLGSDPTEAEQELLLRAMHRKDSQFFATNALGTPKYIFYDRSEHGVQVPYRFPARPDESYRYLSAAAGMAFTIARHAHKTETPMEAADAGRAIVRLGDALQREGVSYTHLFVGQTIKRIGLTLLLPQGGPALKRYVYAQQSYQDALSAKYALLSKQDPDFSALQEKVARRDEDPMWRREAVWSLGRLLQIPHISVQRPLEALTAKATLADAAVHDPDPHVRAAASEAIGVIAQQGAVIRR